MNENNYQLNCDDKNYEDYINHLGFLARNNQDVRNILDKIRSLINKEKYYLQENIIYLQNELLKEKAKNQDLINKIEENKIDTLNNICDLLNEIKDSLSPKNQIQSISVKSKQINSNSEQLKDDIGCYVNYTKKENITNNYQNENQQSKLSISRYIPTLFGNKSQVKSLKLYYFSEDFEYFTSISKFVTLSQKDNLYIQVEKGIEMKHLDSIENTSRYYNLNAIYIIFSSGSRSEYGIYKKDIDFLLSKNCKVSLIIIKIGRNTIPTVFKEFQGTQINLKAFKNDIYDQEDNTQSLKTLINTYINN